MTIAEKLLVIQQGLKAPKDKFNKFGNFRYRSAESIIEAVKPLLAQTKTALLFQPQAVELAGHVRIEMTVSLLDTETQGGAGSCIQAKSTIREDDERKGMTASQNSGSAESFAKKYALGNLFAIDDTSDPDTASNASDGEVAHPPLKGGVQTPPSSQPQQPRPQQNRPTAMTPTRAKAKEAFDAFKLTPQAQGMDKNEQSRLFLASVAQITNNKPPAAMTVEDWSAVAATYQNERNAQNGNQA